MIEITGADVTHIIMSLAASFLIYVGKQVLAYIRDQRDREKAYREGIVSLLRYHIIKSAQIACKHSNITVAYRAELKAMYKSYHNLGGNDVATEWYERALDLPVVEDVIGR